MSKGENGAVKISNIGDVRADDMKDWAIVISQAGQSFIGKPTNSVNDDGRLFLPCYFHNLQTQATGQGIAVMRSAGVMLFLVGSHSARIKVATTFPLDALPKFELEELANMVNAAEAERRNIRQQKGGILAPQIVPPSDIRG